MKAAKLRRKIMKAKRGQKLLLLLISGICILLPSVSFGRIKDFKFDISQDSLALVKEFHLAKEAVFSLSRGLSEDENTGKKKGTVAMEVSAGAATYTSEHFGSGFRYGLGVLTLLSKRVGFELLLERYSVPVDKEWGELGAGKLQATPVLFNLLFRFSEEGPFVPYALLGVGFFFFHFEPEHPLEEQEPELLAEVKEQEADVVDRFSLLFGGGAEYHISRKLAISAEVRYTLVKTWVQASDVHHVDPDEQDKIHLNSLVLSLGIRYFF